MKCDAVPLVPLLSGLGGQADLFDLHFETAAATTRILNRHSPSGRSPRLDDAGSCPTRVGVSVLRGDKGSLRAGTGISLLMAGSACRRGNLIREPFSRLLGTVSKRRQFGLPIRGHGVTRATPGPVA